MSMFLYSYSMFMCLVQGGALV